MESTEKAISKGNLFVRVKATKPKGIAPNANKTTLMTVEVSEAQTETDESIELSIHIQETFKGKENE